MESDLFMGAVHSKECGGEQLIACGNPTVGEYRKGRAPGRPGRAVGETWARFRRRRGNQPCRPARAGDKGHTHTHTPTQTRNR